MTLKFKSFVVFAEMAHRLHFLEAPDALTDHLSREAFSTRISSATPKKRRDFGAWIRNADDDPASCCRDT